MKISRFHIYNFRKLRSVQLDLESTTTLCVGANNSGKTSAMACLGNFLVDPRRFSTNDFCASHWSSINSLGERWEIGESSEGVEQTESEFFPSLDIWFEVGKEELHRVAKIIPTLDWKPGKLGVRLRFEPKEVSELRRSFLEALKHANSLDPEARREEKVLGLWPLNLMEFLERNLRTYFAVHTYLLDPNAPPPSEESGGAAPALHDAARRIDGTPIEALIRVDEINAQRGFGEERAGRSKNSSSRRLSQQLHAHYESHIGQETPHVPEDLGALKAIAKAEAVFGERLNDFFGAALSEIQELGYPALTDPVIKLSARLRTSDGLDHESAVRYELKTPNGQGATDGVRLSDTKPPLLLPEHLNGLGYQNLVSMVFRLIEFRSGWLGLEGTKRDAHPIAPIHLVLIEEPEAHLHAQVQQLFIRKAYNVLRNHADLKSSENDDSPGSLTTQLLVSTHSNHIAHELDYCCIRYFRRKAACPKTRVPFSTVVNLSTTFGNSDETTRFVSRYLKASHADLFFADAVIFVEGSAERILLPQFMNSEEHAYLRSCYVSLLEIGGSHAHRLKPLIGTLGLLTLVLTDIDSMAPQPDGPDGKKKNPIAQAVTRGKKQITNNPTLKKWLPKMDKIDELLDASKGDKTAVDHADPLSSVRVAYQYEVAVARDADDNLSICPRTFEDALVLKNSTLILEMGKKQSGLLRKLSTEMGKPVDTSFAQRLFDAIRKGDKAEFALDILMHEDAEKLKTPDYIAEGLEWLEGELRRGRGDYEGQVQKTGKGK